MVELASNTTTTAATATDLLPLRSPQPDWSHDDPKHPGFVVSGVDDTPGPKAYLILLEAAPGKEEKLASFLQDINAGVNKEPLTGPWFGCRYSKTTFCIFEAFPSADGRHEHDAGPGGQNFFQRGEEVRDILAWPAQLYRLDVMHGKFGVVLGKEVVTV